jgi:hypothetical protein
MEQSDHTKAKISYYCYDIHSRKTPTEALIKTFHNMDGDCPSGISTLKTARREKK